MTLPHDPRKRTNREIQDLTNCPKSTPPPNPAEMLPDDTTDVALKMKYRHPERGHVHCMRIRKEHTEIIKFRLIQNADTLNERVVQSVSTMDLVGGDVDSKKKIECDENESKIYDAVSSDANKQIMNSDLTI